MPPHLAYDEESLGSPQNALGFSFDVHTPLLLGFFFLKCSSLTYSMLTWSMGMPSFSTIGIWYKDTFLVGEFPHYRSIDFH